ncbi:hypothetical protein Tcan_17166 [Toxocara canis]|uniref:Uncharacterized protein n=1 Tax=Toxocara canis TaxID=6265 RepID=A0A0B2VS99_TOXCA|nr:hypothetical protein Tcan_17166 [Toxocara canis]
MVSVRTEGDWRPGQQEIGWKEAPGGGETIRGVEDPTRTDLLKKTQQKKRERDSRARTTSKCWRTNYGTGSYVWIAQFRRREESVTGSVDGVRVVSDNFASGAPLFGVLATTHESPASPRIRASNFLFMVSV